MKRNAIGLVVIGLVIIVSALIFFTWRSGDKGPAEEAFKAAEAAFNASKGEAAKYVPDEVKSMEGALAAIKDKLAKGEYKAVIREAQAFTGKVKDLLDSAKAKKEELTKIWTDLSGEIPKLVEAIQSRVDTLSKSKKLPANLTTEKFADAKSGLAIAKEEWNKALESFKAGNLADAVSAAKSVKNNAVAAMETLGMQVPDGAKYSPPTPTLPPKKDRN
jgi:chromosome segregation ATPase